MTALLKQRTCQLPAVHASLPLLLHTPDLPVPHSCVDDQHDPSGSMPRCHTVPGAAALSLSQKMGPFWASERLQAETVNMLL